MDATTPRTIDSKGRIRLAQMRRHHGPDSSQARSAGARVHFNEAWMALRECYELASAAERQTVADQLYRLSLRFRGTDGEAVTLTGREVGE